MATVAGLEGASTFLKFLGGAKQLFGGDDMTSDEQARVEAAMTQKMSIPRQQLQTITPKEYKWIMAMSSMGYEPASEFVDFAKTHLDPRKAQALEQQIQKMEAVARGEITPGQAAAVNLEGEAVFESLAGAIGGMERRGKETGMDYTVGGPQLNKILNQTASTEANKRGVQTAAMREGNALKAGQIALGARSEDLHKTAQFEQNENSFLNQFNMWSAGEKDKAKQFELSGKRQQDLVMGQGQTGAQQANVKGQYEGQVESAGRYNTGVRARAGMADTAHKNWDAAMGDLGTAQAGAAQAKAKQEESFLGGAPAAIDYIRTGGAGPEEEPTIAHMPGGEEIEIP